MHLSEYLRERGIASRLLYDDRRGGNLLVLAARTPAGLCELTVERHRYDRGRLVLVAESQQAAQKVAEALEGRYRGISRLRNARRAFVHRVERMAFELAETYATRAAEFPKEKLDDLRRLVPGAAAMVGVEGLIHERHHDESAAQVPEALEESGGRRKRAARRYPSRFAVRIDTPGGPRAAQYRLKPGAFEPRGEVLAAIYRNYLAPLAASDRAARSAPELLWHAAMLAAEHRLLIHPPARPAPARGRGQVQRRSDVDGESYVGDAIEAVGDAVLGGAVEVGRAPSRG